MNKNKIIIAIYDNLKKIDYPIKINEVPVKTHGWYVSNDKTLDYAIYLTKTGVKLEASTYMLLYDLSGSEDALCAKIKVLNNNGKMSLNVIDPKVNISLSDRSYNKAMRLYDEDKVVLQDGFNHAIGSAIQWIKCYMSNS